MIYIQIFTNNVEKPVDHKPLSDCYTVTSGFSILIRKNSGFNLFLNRFSLIIQKN